MLTTYAGLQARIAALVTRSDQTDAIKDCITLAEAEMNRRLQSRDMEAVDSAFVISGETAAFPTGYQRVLSFRITSTAGRLPMDYLSPEEMDRQQVPSLGRGVPSFYSEAAGAFIFDAWPATGSATARLRYRRDIPALSDDNTTNWLLTAHPDAYLYGALYHLGIGIGASDTATWKALFDQAIASINREAKVVSTGATLTVRPSSQVV